MCDEFVRFVLAVPELYRDDYIWCKLVKERYPNVVKNSFQSWKNFFFFLHVCVKRLKRDFSYVYSGKERRSPDEVYNHLKYGAVYAGRTFSQYLEYTCQQNTC